MSISVSELFLLDELNNSKILAGSDGLERSVYFVSIMSSCADFQSLKTHEVAIINDNSLLEDDTFLNNLIRNCYLLQISCIAIYCLPEETVPQKLINEAERAKTPLVLLSSDSSLTELINSITAQVINAQVLQLQKALNNTYMFIDIARKGGDISEIASALSHTINLPVLIENEKDELICFDNDLDSSSLDISDLDILTMNREIKHHEYLSVRDEPLQSVYHFRSRRNPDVNFIILPIIYNDSVFGNITVITAKDAAPVNEIILKNAAAFTALSMAAIKSRLDKERLIRDDILISLLHNRREILIEDTTFWLSELQLTDNAPYIVFMIATGCDSDTEQILSLRQMTTTFVRDGYFFEEEGKLLFIRSFRNYSESDIDYYFNELRQMLLKRARGVDFYISISNLCTDIHNLNEAYNQASTALEICKNILPPNSLGYYSKMDLFCLFNEQQNKQLLIQFSSHYLSDLIDNSNFNFDAIGTLQAYLESGCSIEKTSQILYVHKNTLKYRIRRLKDILSDSLDNNEYSLKLSLAIIIYKLFPEEIRESISQY